jgi:cbb3-type cytochrome oxidase maturation protein
METLYLLIPISVVLVFLIAIAFWWSLRSGQFDDLEGPDAPFFCPHFVHNMRF